MKTLITAASLLFLVVPAHATTISSKDVTLIFDWQDNSAFCRSADAKACTEAKELQKKLKAHGYLILAYDRVCRVRGRRCYEIDNLPAR